jgi:uncharacterized protein (DUF2147 family)
MKKFSLMLASFVLGAMSLLAADATGKWSFETAMPQNPDRKMTTTMDLKASGSSLTGTVTTSGGQMQGRAIDIQDGKVDGSKVSFTVMQTTKKGEAKWTYEATIDGDSMKGTRTREGGKGSQEFTAKRGN